MVLWEVWCRKKQAASGFTKNEDKQKNSSSFRHRCKKTQLNYSKAVERSEPTRLRTS